MISNIEQYKIVTGRTEFLESQINSLLADGWQIYGYTFPYIGALAQVMIKCKKSTISPEYTSTNQMLSEYVTSNITMEGITNGIYNITSVGALEAGC